MKSVDAISISTRYLATTIGKIDRAWFGANLFTQQKAPDIAGVFSFGFTSILGDNRSAEAIVRIEF